MPTNVTNRRNVLRGVAVAAGAAGTVGLVGTGRAAAAAPAVPALGALKFHLDGRDIHLFDQVLKRRLKLGDRLSGIGELISSGKKVGEFFATSIFVGDPFDDNGAGRVEQHTFVLRNGLLIGNGVVPHLGGPATFAIIGGSGAFAAARGAYVAAFDAIEDGGDGIASFDFSLEGV